MKNTTLIIAVIVVVAIIVVLVIVGGRSNNSATTSPTTSVSTSASTSASVSPGTTARATSSAANISYNDALKKYSNTRIQFGQYCNATPTRMVVKTGTVVMLDNRSGDARTVSLDAAKYSLVGYGFRLQTVYNTTATPKTIVVDCGGAQNVAQIIVEK